MPVCVRCGHEEPAVLNDTWVLFYANTENDFCMGSPSEVSLASCFDFLVRHEYYLIPGLCKDCKLSEKQRGNICRTV